MNYIATLRFNNISTAFILEKKEKKNSHTSVRKNNQNKVNNLLMKCINHKFLEPSFAKMRIILHTDTNVFKLLML
jgi:hypothetical protein